MSVERRSNALSRSDGTNAKRLSRLSSRHSRLRVTIARPLYARWSHSPETTRPRRTSDASTDCVTNRASQPATITSAITIHRSRAFREDSRRFDAPATTFATNTDRYSVMPPTPASLPTSTSLPMRVLMQEPTPCCDEARPLYASAAYD